MPRSLVKHYLHMWSTSAFGEEIGIWIGRLTEEDQSYQDELLLYNQFVGLNRREWRSKFYAWVRTFIFFCPQTSWFLGLWIQTKAHNWLLILRPLASNWDIHHWVSWFLGLWTWAKLHHCVSVLQVAKDQSWDFLAFITVHVKFYNKSTSV